MPDAGPVRFYAVEPERLLQLDAGREARSAHELLDELPLGVYTAFRTFQHGRFLGLEKHFDRTDKCMELLGWTRRLDRPLVRARLQEAVDGWPLPEAFVRLDVLARTAPELGTTSTCLLSLSTLVPVPERFLTEGVRVEIASGLKRDAPRIKAADFVLRRRPFPLNRQDAYEHLLVGDDGRILEATSANFYAFLGGVLRTAEEGMLEGITRTYVLRLCAELEMRVALGPLYLDDLPRAEEAFLTSSTRGVVPVVRVADLRIGYGQPGPRTLRLMRAYTSLVEREATRAAD
jgi:branched-subunit amino acid aminotransferase/4-amino-4-deoxychorismate lyase